MSRFLGTWKAQIANVKARLPQMPQLGETVQGFEALVLEGEELQSSQDVYRSKLREATLRTKDILRRGRGDEAPAGGPEVLDWPAVFLVVRGAGRGTPKSSRGAAAAPFLPPAEQARC